MPFCTFYNRGTLSPLLLFLESSYAWFNIVLFKFLSLDWIWDGSHVRSLVHATSDAAAQKLLDTAGITDVKVVQVDGSLTDHYNPTNKTLALSSEVFGKSSVAAIGVATHEAGHAIQHATSYPFLAWRSMVVPAANIGTKFGTMGMMVGLALIAVAGVLGKVVFLIGACLYGLLLLFQLVTLPVEFNASNRAKQLVVEAGIVTPQERDGIDKVLFAAAMTYVAAFVTSLFTLIYFMKRAGFFDSRR